VELDVLRRLGIVGRVERRRRRTFLTTYVPPDYGSLPGAGSGGGDPGGNLRCDPVLNPC
jgi:hypothetical protein